MEKINYQMLMRATPARICIGHSGARCTTRASLKFLADHAAANDSVVDEVAEDAAEKLNTFEVRTLCRDKDEMLKRPDKGRLFSEETKQLISDRCIHGSDVQIYFGDGLSSHSIMANIPVLYEGIRKRLEEKGISVGTPFLVRYCRVNTARTIGPLLNAKVTCVLIGERPGLLTSESMSAYFAYNARPDMSESDYTVVANISNAGLVPKIAANNIADLIADILDKKVSGVKYNELVGRKNF